jgi:hypothetical protein
MLSLADIDLSDPETVKVMLQHLEIIDELSATYMKVNDLRVDLLAQINSAGLTEMETHLIFERLVGDKPLAQVHDEVGVSPRWTKRILEEACHKIARRCPPMLAS